MQTAIKKLCLNIVHTITKILECVLLSYKLSNKKNYYVYVEMQQENLFFNRI